MQTESTQAPSEDPDEVVPIVLETVLGVNEHINQEEAVIEKDSRRFIDTTTLCTTRPFGVSDHESDPFPY